ncbi:MAG TPA: hypothetical protein VG734_21600 [Lacunisphaera sp.]|nr:hypothetical protein [Lacunisphaera sp.]
MFFAVNLRPTLLHRLMAGLGVALVLLLSAMAASPELHAWVHGEAGPAADHAAPGQPSGGEDDDGCAVTLFAHGLTALVVFVLLMLARPLARSMTLRAPDWFVVARPFYWLVPSHAPPAA